MEYLLKKVIMNIQNTTEYLNKLGIKTDTFII
jgi:hypothetical protein